MVSLDHSCTGGFMGLQLARTPTASQESLFWGTKLLQKEYPIFKFMNKLHLLPWLVDCVNTQPWVISLIRALFSLERGPEAFPCNLFLFSFSCEREGYPGLLAKHSWCDLGLSARTQQGTWQVPYAGKLQKHYCGGTTQTFTASLSPDRLSETDHQTIDMFFQFEHSIHSFPSLSD